MKEKVAGELSLPRATLSVALGISGGVDSAVAAALLKEQGYEVIGVHLYCWDKGPYCTANKDRASALRVAKHLDIPFVVWDLRKEYKKEVIDYFFDEYKKGRTPNPDVMCNREIKFGIFMEKALRELRVNWVATGHYARLRRELPITNYQLPNNEPLRLLRGVDETKDQSYFLWILTPNQLERILFPIGHLTKKEVREKARELKLPCAERPDSQGICFIGPVNVAKFLREYLPIKSGPVVNTKGEVIGEHDGVWFYTEGQRRGFRLSASGGKPSYPLYVIKKDLKTNTLVVGRGKESEVKEFEVGELNWISPDYQLPTTSYQLSCGVRIRHLGEIMPATLESIDSKPFPPKADQPLAEAISHKLLAKLASPAFGVAPGQSAVFYGSTGSPRGGSAGSTPKGGQAPQIPYEEVLGGGVIEKTAPIYS